MTTYIAVGPLCWGKGTTKEQAIKRARVNWPSWSKHKAKDENFSVWKTEDQSVYCDDTGYVYAENAPLEKIQKSKIAT